MAGDCCGGRVQRLSVASQFVTMVGVFAPWSSGGDPAAWYPEEAWNQADPGGACTIAASLPRVARCRRARRVKRAYSEKTKSPGAYSHGRQVAYWLTPLQLWTDDAQPGESARAVPVFDLRTDRRPQ